MKSLVCFLVLGFAATGCQMTGKRNNSQNDVSSSFATYSKDKKPAKKAKALAKAAKAVIKKKSDKAVADGDIESFSLYSSADLKKKDKKILKQGESSRFGAFD